mgnify:FL=1
MTDKELNIKLNKLEEIIRGYGRMLVALSGGVDSTFLLAFACKIFSDRESPEYDGLPVYEHVSALPAIGRNGLCG